MRIGKLLFFGWWARLVLIFWCSLLAACGGTLGFDFPVTARGTAADYPSLHPIDSYATPSTSNAEADLAALSERAEALRDRAKAMSGPILTEQEKAQLGVLN